MGLFPIFLLIAAFTCCCLAIAIIKCLQKETVLQTDAPPFIKKYQKKISHDLSRSHLNMNLQEYFLLEAGCPVVLAVTGALLLKSWVVVLIFAVIGFLIPPILIAMKKSQENKKFEGRFVRALAQMAAALHSGMTVEQALMTVSDCELLHENIRDDFRVLYSKLKLGMPISNAFYEFAEMTESKDAYDVATAITIMTEVGGDAGVAIEKIQKNIENRLLYRKKRESMMTESKLIALFADIVPLVILAGTFLFMPDCIDSYFRTFATTAIFIGSVIMLIIGSIVVHRMLDNKIDAS